jgi:lipid II:glycine glycyltransferase (peptidoglycan interpeptide bridge formation enzyme)
MEVKIFEEESLDNWERELAYFGGNVFQTAPWLDAFTTKNQKPIYLRFISGEKTVGLVAGLRSQSTHFILRRLTKRFFLFTGPTVDNSNQELTQKCLKRFKDYAIQNGYINLYLGSYDVSFALNVKECGFTPLVRREYVIDLKGSIDDIRQRVSRTRRKEINKGEREGLSFFVTDSLPAVKSLVSCLDSTKGRRKERGFNDYSYYYMPYIDQDIIGKLMRANVGKIFEDRKGNEVVSSNFTVIGLTGAYGLLAGSTAVGYKLGASSFILWKIIETLKDQGAEYYNLGGVPQDKSGSGLAIFKRSFGAEERVCSGGSATYIQGHLINFLSKIYLNIRMRTNR